MKFSSISPLTFKIAVRGHIMKRSIKNAFSGNKIAKKKSDTDLPYRIYTHKSLIMRKLGNTNLKLQENKKVNLGIAAPKITGILIRPGETFSFWSLVGPQTLRNGYLEGVTIAGNKVTQGLGGGMCQFTNLIHWIILHTPLTISEYHSHDRFDLFPDYKRQVPFGVGSSIIYNYLDYRFTNNTEDTYQLNVWTDDTYLNGELLCSSQLPMKYHIRCEDEYFIKEDDNVFRRNKIYRVCNDKLTGVELEKTLIKTNNARVMYDYDLIPQPVRNNPQVS
ncbi:VanW family protein [Erysipelothrix sp. HDW6C]|uniref:VanW family protein n=1 Tax=Erysipelothrix sp. HDW6C TaxID=2714930 RepID=UPI001409E354|nr:VanW family protein [Erysipelothrix sp. HDW6C]QIK69559.1 VanW family protein [Erysipelothrix sp. HDW6C]